MSIEEQQTDYILDSDFNGGEVVTMDTLEHILDNDTENVDAAFTGQNVKDERKTKKIYVKRQAIGSIVGKYRENLKSIAQQIYLQTSDKPYIKINREQTGETSFIIYANTDDTIRKTIDLIKKQEREYLSFRRPVDVPHAPRPPHHTQPYPPRHHSFVPPMNQDQVSLIADEIMRRLSHSQSIPQHYHERKQPFHFDRDNSHPRSTHHTPRQHHYENLPMYEEQSHSEATRVHQRKPPHHSNSRYRKHPSLS